ncbi:MAG TPA: DEAD/DEAH box helicase [Anaerohalosphaeraceae bacterium]|nr:DEAD/DEAH box helicase [Phycisphaerae bacterium]HOK95628.1 DEAD/DEAH box helicase [Anaerohalosphaeraceae bacterium]HOL31831.1 DEAD/DEAH box helicase [Anaerohalosphaeraceae bacterium]HOM77000.1 DEAD/DEAH box helicase [Anaerohalosphaeraceae bacterium]HPC65146.1 DEAD/DEAH box helicase [Anaerohalosphaeraceae bacterium]
MKFTELNLKPEILKALDKKGYTELTPIQEQTFPHVLAGKDLIALAQTGSGKTAACAIPVVQSIDPSLNEVQALILVPTRELALQYVDEISWIAAETGVSAFAVYGGFSMEIQKSKLAHGVQALVATPGRLIDLLYNSPLRLANVRYFVLDEADEMLNQGFLSDIEFIFSCMVHDHHTMLFSATMPPEIKQLAKRYLKDPVLIELNLDQKAPESLSHYFTLVQPHQRFEKLLELIQHEKPAQAIMFCSSRTSCQKLYDQLKKKVKSVELIHGGLDQNKRTSLFRRFKKLDIQYLAASDIAARGLDFSHTTHIFNYDLPHNPEDYTHRTGRTARMGRQGKAITLVTAKDLRKLAQILRANRIEPLWIGPAPDLTAVSRKKKQAGSGRSRCRQRPAGHFRRRSDSKKKKSE